MFDYKKLIKNRNTRLKILNLLSFIPDSVMLKIQYRIYMGRRLNLKEPMRYSEKLQLYKLKYKNPILPICVDKYEVRNYLITNGFGYLLNECYGVYENVNDIDFGQLPEKFVLKDTLGVGGNSVIIVDKKNCDWKIIKSTLQRWLDTPAHIRTGGREWPYYCGKKHRIIIEQYIECADSRIGLVDYKFCCIAGKVVFFNVMGERDLGGNVAIGYFDRSFKLMPVLRVGALALKAEKITPPSNFKEMLEIAEKLAEPFPHVRVDLYNDKNGRIIFGELTFFEASGYLAYSPDSFDFEMGSIFDVSTFDEK